MEDINNYNKIIENAYKQANSFLNKRLVKLTIKIINLQTKTSTTIIDNGRNEFEKNTIIYDPTFSSSIEMNPDVFYTTNTEDLKTIINYLIKNARSFQYDNKKDFLRNYELTDPYGDIDATNDLFID